MKHTSLVILQLALVSITLVQSQVTGDKISQFKNRSTVDDWLINFMVEDDHFDICKSSANSCCFEPGQTIRAVKTTQNSKSVITIEGYAVGVSCPVDSTNLNKKKLSISIYGFTDDKDLTNPLGKLNFDTNIGQSKDSVKVTTISNSQLVVTDKSDQNHYAIDLPSTTSSEYNESIALNHIMIETSGVDHHAMDEMDTMGSNIIRASILILIVYLFF